jgi:hypothetical protein
MINFQEVLARKEELAPELYVCLMDGPFGQAIQHPLVQEIFYTPQHNALYNEQLKQKQEACDKCLAEGDFHAYVFWHERPYRLWAFNKIRNRITEPKTYWGLLGSIWIDSENIWQNIKDWKKLLTAQVPNKEYFMSDEDRLELANLPDFLTIHRGYDKSPNGMSYSLSKTKATWFANRFGKQGKVKTIKIDKSKVFAYLGGRNEKEVIVL